MSLGQLGGRYDLLEKIGEGATAFVYRARDTRLGRLVAVKVLKPEYRDDHAFVERLQREARLAAGVGHPNVVAVYDCQADDQACYVVMEHVEGQSLKARIQERGRLPATEAIAIARQVLAALAAAHHAGVVHRDVKPQNVLVTPEGVAKLTDFGIAHAAEVSPSTPSGAVIGTPHYLSPEQATGQAATAASDLYSTGVVLYEMLTGRPPFDGESAVAVAHQHAYEQPEPPRKLVPGLSASLERVVLRALAKRPEDRWSSAAEMSSALAECAAAHDQPTTVLPAAQRPGLLARIDATVRARRLRPPALVGQRGYLPVYMLLALACVVLTAALRLAFRGAALPAGATLIAGAILAALALLAWTIRRLRVRLRWVGPIGAAVFLASLAGLPGRSDSDVASAATPRPVSSTAPSAGGSASPTATPGPSLEDSLRRLVVPDTPTPTETPTPSVTPSPTPTMTPTATATPTLTPTSTVTPTATPTWTPSSTPSPSPSPTATRTPTSTPVPTPVVVELAVAPRRSATYLLTVPVASGQALSGTIAVQGGNGDVRLTVLGEDGAVVLGPQLIVETYRFTWPANRSGAWQLVFDNTFSLLTTKRVTITYRIVAAGQ